MVSGVRPKRAARPFLRSNVPDAVTVIEPNPGPGESRPMSPCIAKRMAEAHGGSVEVESSREEGTTFTVRLPRQLPNQRAM
jgi:hypothetical protein